MIMEKKKVGKVIGISVGLFVILSIVAVVLVNAILSFILLKTEDYYSRLEKYFEKDKFEVMYINEEAQAGKIVAAMLTDADVYYNSEVNVGAVYKMSTAELIYENGEVLVEGPHAIAFKYVVENGVPRKDLSLFKQDVYGTIPIEMVFTQAEYEKLMGYVEFNPEMEIRIDSYYRYYNFIYPDKVSIIFKDSIVESMTLTSGTFSKDGATYYQDDKMMMDLSYDEGGAWNPECQQLRSELKEYVAKNGFEPGVNTFKFVEPGCITKGITGSYDELSIINAQKSDISPLGKKISLIAVAIVFITTIIVDAIILVVMKVRSEN